MTRIDYFPSFDMACIFRVMKTKSRRGKFYSIELSDGNTLIVRKGKSYFRMKYYGADEVRTEFSFDYRKKDLSGDETMVACAFNETVDTIRKYLVTRMKFIRIKLHVHVVIALLIPVLFPVIIGLSSLKNIFFYGFITSLCFWVIKISIMKADRDISIMENELDAVKNKYKEMNNEDNNKQQ